MSKRRERERKRERENEREGGSHFPIRIRVCPVTSSLTLGVDLEFWKNFKIHSDFETCENLREMKKGRRKGIKLLE